MHGERRGACLFWAVGAYGINLLNIWCGAGWRIFISRVDFLKRQQKTESDFVFTYWPVMNEELIFDEQRTAIGASCSTACRPLCTTKHKGVTLVIYLLCGKDSLLHEGHQLPICRNTPKYYAVVKPSLVSYLSWNQSFGQVLCVVHNTVIDRRCVG